MGSACCKREEQHLDEHKNSLLQAWSGKPEDASMQLDTNTGNSFSFNESEVVLDELFKLPESIEITDETSLVQAVNQLGVNMYQTIVSTHKNRNVIFSPFSIALAVGLVESGADEWHQEDIQRLLGTVVSSGKTVKMTELLGSLRKTVLETPGHDGTVRIANALFCADDLATMKQDYMYNAREFFGAEFFKVPLRRNPQLACQQVNRWISDLTDDHVRGLLESLKKTTMAFLVNALYLKLAWQYPFAKSRTEKGTFYRIRGENREVDFMVGYNENVKYIESNVMQVLELPYKGRSISMYIILPKAMDGVSSIENMNVEKLSKMISSSKSGCGIHMKIPKFTMRLQIDLKEISGQLGWNEWENLTRMTDDHRMAISEAVHEAYIKVVEQGTESNGMTVAESATETVPKSASETRYFLANHPFLFAVMHNPTSVIMLLGKVDRVEEW